MVGSISYYHCIDSHIFYRSYVKRNSTKKPHLNYKESFYKHYFKGIGDVFSMLRLSHICKPVQQHFVFCLIPFGIRHIVMCYDPAETGSWRGYYMTSLDRYQLKVGGWKYSVKKLNQYPWYSGVSDFFAGVRDFVLTAKMEDS